MVKILHLLTPLGDLRIWLIFGVSLAYVKCSQNTTSLMQPSPTISTHRGAARQMYGSGSLRTPGSKPIYATGQRQHGVRSTMSPQHPRKQFVPMINYPAFPLPIPAEDFHRLPGGGFQVYPEIMWLPPRSERLPKSGSGMYGGRTEYYQGRPHHGYTNGRYPHDFGFLAGKGFLPDYPSSFSGKNTGQRTEEYEYDVDEGYDRKPTDDEHDNKKMLVDHNRLDCDKTCDDEEIICLKSCTCIKEEQRCDGKNDCEDGTDEIGCDRYDHISLKCDGSKNYITCPKTNKCISKDWLCDGDDDCEDYSDETHCGYITNCTTDQFQCENGLCIPRQWTCDNDNDCKDFSDEENCTRTGCKENEFECSDTTCISLSWKCDRHMDCTDGSDEMDCDLIPPLCNQESFQCLSSHKCIKIEFKCDGDDDCDDWSDEYDCPKIPGICVSGEFKCNNSKCIPERYRCDKQNDCDENEDEVNCDYNITKTCSPEEYTCENGGCILKTWVCDGYPDCEHGDDESKCELVCDDAKFPCTGIGVNENTTIYCINKKFRCDGQKNCPKGEDEENCPSKRECEQNTKCTQLCVTTAGGKDGCSCFNGYQLSKNGYACEDINECMYAVDPVCSQTCNNTVGSFKCGCMTGYVLRPDLRTCKAVGAPPTLLFANRIDIRQVSLSNSKYTALLKGLHNAIALDYHYEKQYIYWTDVSMDVIRRAFINGTGIIDIIKYGLESPGGVALDWIHNLIFWTDSGTRRIEVASLDGKQRAILAASELDKPRAIAVHPGEALIFWTDWGPNPKIESAEMDGSNRKSIITESVFWPNGLTIDYTSKQIYWADAKHNVIETSLFDGSGRKKVISKGLPHPFAISIFEDAIFWTDWHTKSITTASKTTGAGLRVIHDHLHFPMDIHSYHPQRQPKFRNRCGTNNGGCAHMCLPNKRSFTCVCRMGQKLKPDKKSCQKPDKFLLFARKKDLRIKHLDDTSTHELVVPVDRIKSALAIAWDSRNDKIYWTDIERNTLNRAFWNGTEQEILVTTNIITPSGIAYDWATDKIYWTDSTSSRIEVANSDGSMRSLLVWEEIDEPRDIVVDPQGGFMFWSQSGEMPRIERAHMDGSNRMIIASTNVTVPNGLALDLAAGKIYWTDGGSKTIEFANIDGKNRKVLLGGSSVPGPFGLDIFENYIYWSDKESKSIERAHKITGQNRTILSTNMNDLMKVRVFHRTRKTVRHACSTKNGGCTHLCLLKPNGRTCACPTGIKLGSDGQTCAKGPKNYLIFSHRVDIRQISLDVPYIADVVLPFPSLKLVTTVDVDRKTGEIYFADKAEDTIQKATSNGKILDVIIMHEIEEPDGIALDSSGRKIYWTDGVRSSIEVAELDGRHRKVLFHKDLDTPRAIALHYQLGLLFWTDWGQQPKIEVSHMDGTNRKTIVTKKLQWPNGLSIDLHSSRIYWNDAKIGNIESTDFDGKDRKLIVSNLEHPYGLVVVGNHIYWSDWEKKALYRADKNTGTDRKTLIDSLDGLMDVRSVQNDIIPENACGDNNGGCSHLCLRNPVSFTCACPTGLTKSKKDDKQCELVPSTFLLIATRYALVQISMDTNDLWDVTLPILDIHNVIDVDFHWKKKLLFYTDIERNVIESVSMTNLSDVKVIVSKNLSTPDGVAVDWITNNIYWTNTGNKIIEVARLDGSNRKVIIKDNLHDPRSIAVYPQKGFLFWTDWVVPKIERSFLDGSERKSLVSSQLHFPIGLVVDYDLRRLYWIDAKLNEERVETTDLHGHNRVMLSIQSTHPFSLTQYQEYLYWTDWIDKSVYRAEKISGREATLIRPQLDAAMGITMVAENRQLGWNPCAADNGNCTHLCFFRLRNYTCGCPDEHTPSCKTEPKTIVPSKCDPEIDYGECGGTFYPPFEENFEPKSVDHSNTFYIMTLVPMLFLILIFMILVFFLLIKKGKKKYLYGTSRSFSNPNYYSPNRGATVMPTSVKGLSKRLKYNKSQERVYEETVCVSSPEIISLIPTALTPCSSNCEAVTPEIEISPSVTPLHKNDILETVVT